MAHVIQPLTWAERHRAIRSLERAAMIVRNGQWIALPFMPFLCVCMPLGPVVIVWFGLPLIFFQWVRSYFEEAAEDINNRQQAPLLASLTISALLVALTLMMVAALAVRAIANASDSGRWVFLALGLAMSGASIWMLVTFIRAWNALKGLRTEQTGFDVVLPAGQTDQAPLPSGFVLPPRPQRATRPPKTDV